MHNNILKRVWQWLWKSVRSGELFTFCLFLVFATIIWFGHALNVVRETTVSVEIQYVGIPDNVNFESRLPSEFHLTIRDQGKRLQQYSKEQFPPVILDLAPQLQQKDGTVTITSEAVRQKMTDQLQGTTKLQRIVPENITVNYFREEEKTVPVRFGGQVRLAQQYQFVVDPYIEPKKIKIYGKQETLSDIDYLYCDAADISDVKDTFEMAVPIVCPEGVRLQKDSISLKAVAEQFTDKQFVLPIETVGVPKGAIMRLFPCSTTVTIRLGMRIFSQVSQSDLRAVCYYPSEPTDMLKVKVLYDVDGISNIRLQPAEVEYIIERR